jgi:hypothetical protein
MSMSRPDDCPPLGRLQPPTFRSAGSRLSTEVIFQIMHHFIADWPITTFEYTSDASRFSSTSDQGHLTLRNVCLASSLLLPVARGCLYERVVIQNCRELLCFFRTLNTTPSIRDLVRSFAWVCHLPENETPATEFDGLTSLLADCYESIPRPLTLESAFISRVLDLDGRIPDTFRACKVLGLVLFMLPKVRSLCTTINKCFLHPASSGETVAQVLADGGQPAHQDAHLRRRATTYEVRCFSSIAKFIKTHSRHTHMGWRRCYVTFAFYLVSRNLWLILKPLLLWGGIVG